MVTNIRQAALAREKANTWHSSASDFEENRWREIFVGLKIRPSAAAGLFLMIATPIFGQIGPLMFFPSDRTVNTALPGSNIRDGVVGFSGLNTDGSFKDPTSPTVKFVENGSYNFTLFLYNESKVEIDGGKVDNNSTGNFVVGFNKGTTILKNGSIRSYRGFEDSKFEMTGGTVRGVVGNQNASLSVTGGLTTGVITVDNATATVVGVTVGGLLSGGGSISMTGGAVTSTVGGNGEVQAGGGTINLSGVAVEKDLTASRQSDGRVGTINFSGGSALAAGAFGGIINLSGGSIAKNLEGFGDGEIRMADTTVGGSVTIGFPGGGGSTNGLFMLTSGSIATDVRIIGQSSALINGGSIGGGL
jgi:hypothetical protein